MTERVTQPRRITVVSHAVIVEGRDNFGPAHNVADFFVAAGIEVDFVLHPLTTPADGFARRFRERALVSEQILRYGRLPRLREALFNALLAFRSPADVVVIVDPVNFASAGFLRKLRRRGLIVYYTADYADRRFGNPVLNRLYHGLDRAALRAADVVWNVSQRITDKRREQGVADERNVLVPNSPSFEPSAVVPFDSRAPESVVFVGWFDTTLDDELLLDCLERARRSRPEIQVTVIGTGAGEARFRSALERRGLARNVRLTGYLPRDEALSIVRQSRVGLALYSGRASWNEYGDSVKVREYLSLGLPVVSTPNHAVARELELREAGVLVTDSAQASAAIDALLGQQGPYAAERAAEMGRAYDREAVLGEAVAQLSRLLGENETHDR